MQLPTISLNPAATDANQKLAAIHQLATSALQTSWLYSGKEHVKKLMREIAEISGGHRGDYYDGLNVFEIHSVRWEGDDHKIGTDWRTIIVCKDIAAAWRWIESDRLDPRTEVRTIHMLGQCCQVVPVMPEIVDELANPR